MSLTNKITITILISILLPSALIFGILYLNQSSYLVDNRISRLKEVAQLRKSEILSSGENTPILEKIAKNYTFLGNTGEIVVVSNKNGELSLAAPPRFSEEVNESDLKAMLASSRVALTESKVWKEIIDYRGHKVIAIAEPLEGLSLILFIKQDIFEVKKPLADTGNIFLLTFFIISIAGVFIGLALGKSLADPVRQLSFTVDEFKKNPSGNFRSSITSNDEIGLLAANFNEMAAGIREFYATLEKKVAERTQELSQQKKALEEKIDEYERLNKLMVGRELKMVELKKDIRRLNGN